MGIGVKATIGLGVVMMKNESVVESKTLLKFRISNFHSLFGYFGMKYSFDGFTLLLGLKIGGVKLLFPIVVLNKLKNQKLEPSDDNENL